MTTAWRRRLTGSDRTPPPGRVDVAQAYEKLSADKLAQIIDVREPSEWAETGVPPRALLIPLGQIEQRPADVAGVESEVRVGIGVQFLAPVDRAGHRSRAVLLVVMVELP